MNQNLEINSWLYKKVIKQIIYRQLQVIYIVQQQIYVNPSPDKSKLMFPQEAFQSNMNKRCPFVDDANANIFSNSTRPKCVLKNGKR